MVADHILQTDSSPHNPLTSNEIGFRKFGNVSTLDSLISVDGCFTETHFVAFKDQGNQVEMDYICSIFQKEIYLDLLIIVISKNLRKNTSSKGLLKIYTSNLKQCNKIAYYY